MHLRSGKVVTSNKAKKSNKSNKSKKSKKIESKNKKTQTDIEYDVIDAAHTLLNLKTPSDNYSRLFNEKIELVSNDLQEDCEYYLRKIIIESFRKGINIKFEK